MKIGVIGCGVVGGALISYLENTICLKGNGHAAELVLNDPTKGFYDTMDGCKAVFVCVSAPTALNLTKNEYYLNTDSVMSAMGKISESKGKPIVFIRTTVTPDLCDDLNRTYNLNIVALPEFLTERTAHYDMHYLNLISGAKGNPEAIKMLKEIFPNKEIIHVTNKEAFYGKHVHNAFAAVKINFFNQVNRYCKDNNISYESVKNVFLSTGHIKNQHVFVPGPDGKKGYGGKCLPKDIKIFSEIMKNYTTVPRLSDIENGLIRKNEYKKDNT